VLHEEEPPIGRPLLAEVLAVPFEGPPPELGDLERDPVSEEPQSPTELKMLPAAGECGPAFRR
jgi:hypothetical protein